MSEYKRKKVHTSRRRSKAVQIQKPESEKNRRIKRDITQDSSIRVVKGKKGEKRIKIYTALATVTVIALLIVLMSVILPVGLVESTKDFVLSLGSGSFPAELSGAQTVDCATKSNYYYVLTDTSIMAFSNGGKKIFSSVHGFSSPVIVTSETRALVYDQGKTTAIIYNLSGVVDTINSKNEIICADIAKNGQYALATKSDSYASSVSVYSRKGKNLYSIKLAKDIVNNVDISNSGKKIAVSTVNAESGKLVSGVSVYAFDSADPAFKYDLGQDIAFDIENTGRGFYVTTHNKLRFINWSKYTVNEYDLNGEVSSVRYSSSGVLAVHNKTNDKSDNDITLLSNSGKKISEFEVKSILADIRFSRGRVYSIGDNRVNIYDKHGELLRSDECDFGGVKLSVTGSNEVCVISDNEIQKITVNKGD